MYINYKQTNSNLSNITITSEKVVPPNPNTTLANPSPIVSAIAIIGAIAIVSGILISRNKK